MHASRKLLIAIAFLLSMSLLLGGIGLGFFFSAVLLLLMTLASDGGLKRTILWMSGDLSSANWERLSCFGLPSVMTRCRASVPLTLRCGVPNSSAQTLGHLSRTSSKPSALVSAR